MDGIRIVPVFFYVWTKLSIGFPLGTFRRQKILFMQKMDHVILLSVMQFISDASLLNRMIGRKLKTEIIPEFRSNTLAEIKVSELKI